MKDLMIFSAGKFRHLPVVENGEVIAMLDIAKCLYDSISRMEKAAERGSAIAAAVESVERQWGSTFSGQYWFIISTCFCFMTLFFLLLRVFAFKLIVYACYAMRTIHF